MTPTNKSFSSHLLAVFLFFLITANGFADNGAIAWVYPISHISIDGDLSDWPSDMDRYAIDKFAFGSPLLGEADIQANFRIGYNLATQSIYVAVEVTDDIFMGNESEEAAWNTQDAHNLYVAANHTPNGSGVISHFYSKDFRRLAEGMQHLHWDPLVRSANWENVEVEIRQNKEEIIYEWRIFLGDQLTVGRTIGFDYEVLDKDPEEENFPSVMTWGPGGGKSFGIWGLGDAVMLEPETQIGQVSGNFAWQGNSMDELPSKIQFHQKGNPACWIQANTNGSGQYSLDLPEGTYVLRTPISVSFDRDEVSRIKVLNQVEVTIVGGQKTQADTVFFQQNTAPDLTPEKGIALDFSPDKAEQIDAYFDTMMDFYQIPGISFALIKDGKIAYIKDYGYRNTASELPVEATTLFEAGSVTKAVFAYAVNRLAQKGIIDLDKALYQYLPYPDIEQDERYQLITARHVLSHQTGFPNWRNNNPLSISFTPGTKFGYSGEGFEYLKSVIVEITGKSIEEVLEQEVLGPTGLTHAHFSDSREVRKHAAHGHYIGIPDVGFLPKEAFMAYSLQTNAHYFADFMISLMKEKGMKKDSYKKMLTTERMIPGFWDGPEGWQESYGLGFHLKDSPYGKVYGHGGVNSGFRCNFEIYQDLNIGYVYFSNSHTGNGIKNSLRQFLITGKTP
ncbi:MAG: serine hydrolase [Bacteroidota bacterium]